jgi:hypothetical protein
MAANAPASGPRQFSTYLNDPKVLAEGALDETLLQLQDQTGRVLNLPFFRPPNRR